MFARQYFNVRLRVFECGLLTRADPTRLFRCLAQCCMDFRKTARILGFLQIFLMESVCYVTKTSGFEQDTGSQGYLDTNVMSIRFQTIYIIYNSRGKITLL